MKKTCLLLLALAATFCPPDLSASSRSPGSPTPPPDPAAAAAAAAAAVAADRADKVQQVVTLESILRDFMATPATAIPSEVLKKARAIIITNQYKIGFILGIQGGEGVIMVKKANGQWSIPVLLSTGEASLGLQIGGKSIQTVYIITDDQTPRLLLTGQLAIGADAKAVVGPKAADTEAWKEDSLHKVPVLVYSKDSGLFAGATVKAGILSRNDAANASLYNTTYSLPELLYGDWVKPIKEVQPLMDYLKQISP